MSWPEIRHHTRSDARDSTGTLLRACGIVVLAGGLIVAYQVVTEAWNLFRDDSRIVEIAKRVDGHSGVDTFVAALSATVRSEIAGPEATSEPRTSSDAEPAVVLRASYFAAWFLATILLGVIGRLALAAIHAGAALARYTARDEREIDRVAESLSAKLAAQLRASPAQRM